MSRQKKLLTFLLILLLFLTFPSPSPLAYSPRANSPLATLPLTDMGTDTYLGFEGGLYPDSNTLPPAHASAGVRATFAIQPRAVDGSPDPNGTILLLSIGMSNANQEFCGSTDPALPCHPWTFMGQAATHPNINPTLTLLNGAAGGQVAYTWNDPTDPNYDRIRDDLLAPLGLSENQVQIVWAKVANPNPSVSLPAANADAYLLLNLMGSIARALKTRYPHLQQVFFTSRLYAGYATTPLNPEPYAYESGFAVKWLIEAQIHQMDTGEIDPLAGDLAYPTTAPWLAWGPYLWADGTNPRSDGLTWASEDFEADGTHPSQLGETKVGAMLLDFFLNSPQTMCWFRAGEVCGGHTVFLPLIASP
ncbi:MAG: hypothetical protein HUU38_13700 [Anaerolineales bacterium]|nr:hypothetical protein [Anaerolineales bacterium]